MKAVLRRAYQEGDLSLRGFAADGQLEELLKRNFEVYERYQTGSSVASQDGAAQH